MQKGVFIIKKYTFYIKKYTFYNRQKQPVKENKKCTFLTEKVPFFKNLKI